MDTGLLEPVHFANRCARDETPSRNDGTHFLDHLEKELIRNLLRALVIQIDEKSKNIRLLLDDIDPSASTDGRHVLDIECVRVSQRNIQNSAIHEDVCPWSIGCPPFFKHT